MELSEARVQNHYCTLDAPMGIWVADGQWTQMPAQAELRDYVKVKNPGIAMGSALSTGSSKGSNW